MLERQDNFITRQALMILKACLLLCLLLASLTSMAQESPARFSIESADIYQSANNYYLNAAINYTVSDEAHEILAKGLPIHILFELELFKTRRYWLDKTLLEKEYGYILQHDPITDQYELTRLDTNFTLSYATAEAALESLRYLSNLFVVETKNIAQTEKTLAQLRLTLDVRNFPEPMQYLSQYWGDWVTSTKWYEWPLAGLNSQGMDKLRDNAEVDNQETEDELSILPKDGDEGEL